jgi:hypothetical protein
MRRLTWLLAAVAVPAMASPAGATPATTEVRTIRDVDGDDRLEYAPGERHVVLDGAEGFRPPPDGSILNFLQLSDFQMVDEESPGRVEFFDTTQRGPFAPFSAAYRPRESLTTQVTSDGTMSMVLTILDHAGPPNPGAAPPDLTGDGATGEQVLKLASIARELPSTTTGGTAAPWGSRRIAT